MAGLKGTLPVCSQDQKSRNWSRLSHQRIILKGIFSFTCLLHSTNMSGYCQQILYFATRVTIAAKTLIYNWLISGGTLTYGDGSIKKNYQVYQLKLQ